MRALHHEPYGDHILQSAWVAHNQSVNRVRAGIVDSLMSIQCLLSLAGLCLQGHSVQEFLPLQPDKANKAKSLRRHPA